MQRPKSAELQFYEVAAEPLARKLSLAMQVARCGIKSDAWLGEVNRNLDTALFSGRLGDDFRKLSRSDQEAANRFNQHVFNEDMDGGLSCKAMLTMPFVDNPAAFAP